VPLIVTVAAPIAAVADAVSVRVDVAPVASVGLNAAVTPLGRPVAVRFTGPANPFVRVMVTVVLPAAPCCTGRAVGWSASVKPPGGAVTVSCNVVVLSVCPAAVPRTVIVDVPAAAFAPAVNVSTDALVVVLFGLNTAVTPAGRPSAANVTAPAKPPARVMVMLEVPVPPAATVVAVADPRAKLMCEEIFGPVLTLHVYPAARWQETLALVDRTSPYALTGAVFAQDRVALLEADRALRNAAGNYYVNDKPTGAVVGQQPFGGARASGTNDKAGSILNLMRWISPRTIKETFDPPKEWRYPFMQEA